MLRLLCAKRQCMPTSADACVSGFSRADITAAKMAVGLGCRPAACTTSKTAPTTAHSCWDAGCCEWRCLFRISSANPTA